MMAGEIKIGMDFGSYKQMTDKLKRKYNTKSTGDNKKNIETEYLFLNKGKNKGVVGNAYREALQFSEYGVSKYVNAVLFYKDYQYGTRANEWEALDKFDYVQGTSQYAIDFNGNNKVDEGEIFDGKLNYDAYRFAKESGDLNNYKKFDEKYHW